MHIQGKMYGWEVPELGTDLFHSVLFISQKKNYCTLAEIISACKIRNAQYYIKLCSGWRTNRIYNQGGKINKKTKEARIKKNQLL